MSGLAEATLRHFRTSLGFLHGFNWARFAYLIPFLAVTAAAIGISQLQHWRDGFAKSRSRWSGNAITAIVVVLIALLCLQSIQIKERTLKEMLQGANYRALYLNPVLQQLSGQSSVDLSLFRVATISLGNTDPPWPPNAAWAYGFNTADGYLNLQSKRYREFWELVINPLTERDRARYDWVHFWGNQLYLFSPTYGFPEITAAASASVDFSNYYRLNLLSLANVRYIISPVPLADPALSLVSSDFVKAQLAWNNQSLPQRLWDMLRQRSPGTALYIYENKEQLPRAFCATSVQHFADQEQLYSALSQATVTELHSRALLNAGNIEEFRGDTNSNPGEVTSLQYSSDRVALSVQTVSPCALVLTDTYGLYWKAQLDGAPASLSPVDGTFQGLILPAGNHRLRLTYAPPYSFR